MKWTKLTIDTSSVAVDLLSAFLDEEGVLGIEIDDNIPLTDEEIAAMFVDLLPEEMPTDDGTARVSCYLDDTFDEKEIVAKVEAEIERLKEFIPVGAGTITLGETEDVDWMNNWKAYFKPFRLYDNILIKPTWEPLPEDAKDDDIVIEIDPGAAFGTGSHETTRLCIGRLKDHMKPGDAVLDLGSGSGILSFVCKYLGAAEVLGIDIDETAVNVSIENREVNNISENDVKLICGNVLADDALVASIEPKYDIVVANILADVIIPMSAIVDKFMKPSGKFICSGIIDMKADEVREALAANGFKIVDTVQMGDWFSFVAELA